MNAGRRSIAEILATHETSDGLYQAVRLEDDSYGLIQGGGPVQPRQVLPFDPPKGVGFDAYPTRGELEADLAAALDDIENSDLMLERRIVGLD